MWHKIMKYLHYGISIALKYYCVGEYFQIGMHEFRWTDICWMEATQCLQKCFQFVGNLFKNAYVECCHKPWILKSHVKSTSGFDFILMKSYLEMQLFLYWLH